MIAPWYIGPQQQRFQYTHDIIGNALIKEYKITYKQVEQVGEETSAMC